MSPLSSRLLPAGWRALAGLAVFSLSLGSQAAIFEDADARRAILDLRQRLEAVQRRQAEDATRATQAQQSSQSSQANSDAALARLAEDNAQLRRSLLELSNQIEQLRAEMSRQTGQKEMALREVAELQRRLRDLREQPTGIDEQRLREVTAGLEARLRRLEPSTVSVDGREFLAEPAEVRDFDAALAVIRRGEFVQAEAAFATFLQRHPTSGYGPSARFWLGSAQYAARSYKESLATLRSMLQSAPGHPRAPDAMLSIANAQIELKEPRAAVRKTLEDLIKAHPQSEAASAAKDQLARLK